MGALPQDIRLMKFEPPLPKALAEELIDFWELTFLENSDDFWAELAGAERDQNQDFVYLVRKGDELGGACRLTVSRTNPELGGIGVVATVPKFRRMGIAGTACGRALDDFRTHGGQALFLSTKNPAAGRVYHRLGWRKLAGIDLMACVTSGDSPEAFLVDYYRDDGAVAILPGTPAERIPMIPLLISPHDWQVLDANVTEFSTRYSSNKTCMDLYSKYASLAKDGRGAWFAARTDRGRLVGLSTARLGASGQCQVDGFTHGNHLRSWRDLVQEAISWGLARGATECEATISVEDEQKRSLFESLGFRQVAVGDAFNLDGRRVPSVRLDVAAANILV